MKSLRLTIAALATAAIAITASNVPSVLAQGTPTADPADTEMTMPAAPAQGNMVESDATSQPNSSLFGAQETSQDPYILVAQPTSRLGGRQRYGLMIIEQKRSEPLCYSTTGSNPTQVNILLLNFDFSGICGKSTDTNGYIVRVNGQDIAYDPTIEEKDGVLVMYGMPRRSAGSDARPIIIGQTDGIAANGFTKITMRPGWRLTRQTYTGNVTGRTYLTNDSTLAQLVQQSGGDVIAQPPTTPTTPPTTPITPPTTPTTPPTANRFPDISGDIYANAINRAVQLGFISGFAEDNTFRPKASLSREQLVSIVIDGLEIPNRPAVTANPYPDVPTTRWSAPKIQLARDLGLVSGYGDGTFKPTQPVTRAELLAVMRRAAEYKNQVTQLVSNQPGRTFSDTQGHWANSLISNMSEYCGIATPLNESGNAFFPNQTAQRNYAAAAMVRLLDCSQTTAGQ
ncbi:MAG: Protein of unknown function (DUF3747)/S-layer homology domain [Phormidesmis priestleyi Ana]|uniref:SLH domain-containing protein n=1 Tax=Phormidesmis priestleyi Ana TaxID=1666911 RepID=A0A0P7ZUN1_9CYAN|nr:MAG: Protein of unknown function (DUF3747)/S-layer homology domain [Phormidesmis priestleyi Ana]